MLTPEEAFYKAKKSGGSNKLRAIVCGDPKWAYLYAREANKISRWDTYDGTKGTIYQVQYERDLRIPQK